LEFKKFKILIFLFAIVINACQKDKKQLLIGSWVLYDVKTSQIIENPESYQLAINELKSTTRINFYPNNIFEGTIWGDTTFGTWQLVNDTIYVADKSFKNKFKVYIKNISAEKLVLEETEDSITSTLIFKKSK